MALNFTGSLPPPEEPTPGRGRAPVTVLASFGVAALLAGLVFAVALRQHKLAAPPPLPALVGVDATAPAAVQPSPKPVAPAPAEPAWTEHKAVVAPPAPAQTPQAQDPAVGKARMLAALRQVPHGVITLSIEDDPEAQALGRKLAGLFREAGWNVDEVAAFGSGPPRRGVAVALGGAPAGEAVREAFDAVGFKFSPPPSDGIAQTPEIFVGVPVEPKP